jgi:hypothetical protein
MTVSITHTFVSPVVDEVDPNEVGPDEWNAAHTLTGLGTGVETALGNAVDTAGGLATADSVSNHLGDTSDAHDASAISFSATGGIASTDVQAAIAELDTEKLASSAYTAADVLSKLLTVDGAGSGLDADLLDGNSSAFFATATGLSDHLADTSDAHDASAISFSANGNLAATDVQAAIDELDDEKHPLFTTLAVANGGTGQATEAEAIGELIQALTEDTTPDYSADYWGGYDASADTGKKHKLGTVVREKLFANRTYYVRTDGSDSNTGLANTAGGAFLTIQKAVDAVLALDCNNFYANISIGAGTFSENVVVGYPALSMGGGPVVAYDGWLEIVGAGATTIIDGTTFGFNVYGGAQVYLEDVTIATASSSGIQVDSGGSCWIKDVDFSGTSGSQHILVSAGGVLFVGIYTISGGGVNTHMAILAGGYVQHFGACTLTGTLNFATQFFLCTGGGAAYESFSGSFTGGTITGTRYTVSLNATANTGGGGASYFPGDVAGSTATGGQYA